MRTILTLLLLYTISLSAQNAALSAFSAEIVGQRVFISWTLTAGNTCQGIDIERALPGEAFEVIGHIDGVCGSEVEDEDFEFIDERPLVDQTVQYRLLLGIFGATDTITLRYFNTDSEGFGLIYRPQDEALELNTVLSHSSAFDVHLMDSAGRLLQQAELSAESLRMDLSGTRAGVYLVQVYDEGDLLYSSRFVKAD